MFYLEKKEKVMVTAKDIYGFKKTAVKERWRGVACSEIREEVEVVARVVVELVRVACVKCLGVTQDVGQRFCVFLEYGRISDLLHVICGAIHGKYHGRGDNFVAYYDVAPVG